MIGMALTVVCYGLLCSPVIVLFVWLIDRLGDWVTS